MEAAIHNQPQAPTRRFEALYKDGFYAVARYVSRQGGTFDDARDVFHDAMVILYEEELKGRKIEAETAYMVGTARNLWNRRLREISRISDRATATAEEIAGADETPSERKILALLETAGRKCMDLLAAFYLENDGLDRLRSRFGFSSDHSASVQKYKCIEKIRETVHHKMMSYEDFFE